MKIFTKNYLPGVMVLLITLLVGTQINYAATGNLVLGGYTYVPDLTLDGSGTGWTWDAATETLTLNSNYNGVDISIWSNNSDVINLVYSGDIFIYSHFSAISCMGSLNISGDGGILTLMSNNGSMSCINAQQNLTIGSNANINIKNSSGIAIECFNNMTIKDNATVTCSSDGMFGKGMLISGNTMISTTGIVNIRSIYSYAVDCNNISIEKGMINLWAPFNRYFTSTPNTTGGSIFYNPPIITSLSENSGDIAGGTSVVLTGEFLTDVTGVKVGGTNAAGFTIDSNTQITFTTPAGTAGTVDVVLERSSDGATVLLKDGFTYRTPTGIFDADNTETSIYLNAFENMLYVNNAEERTLQIIHPLGMIVMQKNIDTVAESVDLNILSPGMYIVSITGNGKNIVKKIIKR